MTNKETHNSLKMDAHLIDNTLFEELKSKYIYSVDTIKPNLKIDIPENDNESVQLFCQHEKQDLGNLKQFPINSKRLDNIKENN